MSVARRPLLTATAAGTLLCALWFVPSANATGERPAPGETERRTTTGAASGVSAQTGEGQLRLADTGGVDTTPYLFGVRRSWPSASGW
ncbi:hypothetical protein GCM10023237_23430 [Streptomyces coeruleoprunus]